MRELQASKLNAHQEREAKIAQFKMKKIISD